MPAKPRKASPTRKASKTLPAAKKRKKGGKCRGACFDASPNPEPPFDARLQALDVRWGVLPDPFAGNSVAFAEAPTAQQIGTCTPRSLLNAVFRALDAVRGEEPGTPKEADFAVFPAGLLLPCDPDLEVTVAVFRRHADPANATANGTAPSQKCAC